MPRKITDKCIACGSCAANCPVECIDCGACQENCPVEAIVEE